MSEIQNSEVIREFCEAYNRHDVAAIMDLCAEGCSAVYPDLVRHPRDEWASLLTREVAAFPDGHIAILSLIAQGDQVALEFGWKATHTGTYGTRTPTGEVLDFPCVFIFDLEDTRIKESRLIWNTRLWKTPAEAAQASREKATAETR